MEIQNYPNYLIYEDGRIYSKKFKRYLKPGISNSGYQYVNLYKDGKNKKFSIHRLVGNHYIPNPDNLPTIDHIDRNKLNNHISNLRWADMKMQCANQKTYKTPCTNTSGHKYISYDKSSKKWSCQYKRNKISKKFNTKRDAICYKFIMILKHRLYK
jgi:hypothetical protein